jgi:hypothetical protein
LQSNSSAKTDKKISDGNEKSPVFTFSDGTLVTNQRLNAVIRFFLGKRIGSRTQSYSCQSFRGSLPSALASKPNMENDGMIKKWGRWKSDAFKRYTRLDHIAKRATFENFVNGLDDE